MRPALGLLMAMVGCTWVSDEDIQARLDNMDNDGDGFTVSGGGDPAQADCDDGNRNIYPGADDPWYDGIDSNCDGANDWDKDGDGWVRAGCEELGCEGQLGDCNDENPNYNPGAEEIWYDNIDGDCDGSDDFDQDGDGSRIRTASGGQDCDDTDPAIGPEATEVWYDGVDQDCDGANDYDQDGDLYVVAGCEQTSDCVGARGGGDCDDTLSTINPGAIETWRDGVDQNCDGLNDFDVDRDGFVQAGCDTSLPDCPGALLPGDCDDDARLIYPGGLEDVSDLSYDGDCDGAADSATLVELDLTIEGGQNLRIAEHSAQVYLVPAADRFTYSDGTELYDTAVAHPVSFVPPVDGAFDVADLHPWPATNRFDPTNSIADGHRVFTVDMDSRTWFCGATGELSSTGRVLTLACYQLSTQGGGGPGSRRTLPDTSSLAEPFADIAFAVDGDGNLHAFGCSDTGSGTLQYVVATEDDLTDTIASSRASFPGLYASACALHVPDDGSGLGYLSFTDGRSGEHVLARFDAEGAPDTSFSAGFSAHFTELWRGAPTGGQDVEVVTGTDAPLIEVVVDSSGRVLLFADGAHAATALEAPTGAPALRASAVWNPQADRVYVTWADRDGMGWLAWIDPYDASPAYELASLGLGFSAEEVVPHYSSTRYLYVAALGTAGELAVVGIEAP